MYIYARMKAHILSVLAIAGSILVSCTQKAGSPEQEAVRAKVAENAGTTPENVEFYSFEQIDSVKLKDEIARRRSALGLRLKVNSEKYIEYNSRGLMKNAARKLAEADADARRLKALDSIEIAHKSQSDSIIARDFVFTGQMRPEGGKWTQMGQMYATVTPSLRVLAVSAGRADLHKSTGHAIPGYDALFKD